MSEQLLNAAEAAARLGIARATLYAWLGDSDTGQLVIRGHAVTVTYFQGGRQGEGRIQIPANEVERLHELMRVRPQVGHQRLRPIRRDSFPGITVPLGLPDR